jgi:hypothetical protein
MLDLQNEVKKALETLVAEVQRRALGEVARLLEEELDERRARRAVIDASRALQRVQKELPEQRAVAAASRTLRRIREKRSSRHAERVERPWGASLSKRRAAELRAIARAFTSFVEENPGLRMEEINLRLALETKELRLPVAKLIAGGAIRTEGAKRSRRYFATAAQPTEYERKQLGERVGEQGPLAQAPKLVIEQALFLEQTDELAAAPTGLLEQPDEVMAERCGPTRVAAA